MTEYLVGPIGISHYDRCLIDVKHKVKYRQISNKSRTLVGNEIVDRSDIVGASPVFILDLTSGFNWLGKEKM